MALTSVLLGLIVVSLVASGTMTLIKGSLPLSVVLWLGGMGAGAVLVALSGVFVVQLTAPSSFAGNGGLLLMLLFTGVGILTGAWSVAWGYWLAPAPSALLWFQLVGLLGSCTVVPVVVWVLTVLLDRLGRWLNLIDHTDASSALVLAAQIGSALTALLIHSLTRLVARLVL